MIATRPAPRKPSAHQILTVQPLGVVLKRPLEGVLPTLGCRVVQISPENDCVRLGELGVGAGVQAWQIAGVAFLHPNGGGVVRRVVGALGYAHAHPRDMLGPRQPRQIRLRPTNSTLHLRHINGPQGCCDEKVESCHLTCVPTCIPFIMPVFY